MNICTKIKYFFISTPYTKSTLYRIRKFPNRIIRLLVSRAIREQDIQNALDVSRYVRFPSCYDINKNCGEIVRFEHKEGLGNKTCERCGHKETGRAEFMSANFPYWRDKMLSEIR